MLSQNGNILDGNISIFQGSEYILPELNPGECVEVTALHTQNSRTFSPNIVSCSNENVHVYKGPSAWNGVYGRALFDIPCYIIGFRYNGDEGGLISGDITYWRIMPIGTTDTSGITITELSTT